jgi:hypothetical protein
VGLVGTTFTIQATPKRSITMPKRGDQNVWPRGIWIWPPAASAAKIRSAVATSGTESTSENPRAAG